MKKQEVIVEKKLQKFGKPEDCPVRNVLDRISDKWSVLVLMVLEEGNVLRFSAIHDSIRTISQKMLTVTLKSLEADGLILRTVYPQIPPRVEYQLTSRGKSLLPHLHNLAGWAASNMQDIQKSRQLYSAQTALN